jgi:hypothetical protein
VRNALPSATPWHLGPEGGDPVASGFDVAIVRNDVIAELYTVITK